MNKTIAIAAAVISVAAALTVLTPRETPPPPERQWTVPTPPLSRPLRSASPEEIQRTLEAIPAEHTPPQPRRYTPPKTSTQSTPSTSPVPPPNSFGGASPRHTAPVAQTIYITNTGEKYHRQGCRHLAKSAIPISLAHAQNRGYTPCSVCATL